MPRDRPRWAMFTRPVTKSGRSRTMDANSSMTMTSRGSGRAPPLVHEQLVVLDVFGAGRGQGVLAPGQLSRQRGQRPFDLVRVEVGHHADGVRQLHAVRERAAALVVDEDERHLIGPVGDRERGDDRLQQLGLPRPGGARDQRMRPVLPQVDAERPVIRLAHDGEGRPAAAPPASRDHRRRGRLDIEHVQEPSRIGQHRRLIAIADIPHRRDRPRQRQAPARKGSVGADLADDVGQRLLHAQPARFGHDDGLAFGGQQPLVGYPGTPRAPRRPGRRAGAG